jgi:hypothetical protein
MIARGGWVKGEVDGQQDRKDVVSCIYFHSSNIPAELYLLLPRHVQLAQQGLWLCNGRLKRWH